MWMQKSSGCTQISFECLFTRSFVCVHTAIRSVFIYTRPRTLISVRPILFLLPASIYWMKWNEMKKNKRREELHKLLARMRFMCLCVTTSWCVCIHVCSIFSIFDTISRNESLSLIQHTSNGESIIQKKWEWIERVWLKCGIDLVRWACYTHPQSMAVITP